MKKRVSIISALVLMISTVFNANIYAKEKLPEVSKSKPIITYTYNSSGKAYAYTSADLKTKTGGYIECAKDECKIIEIKGDAVKVIYPVGNKTKTAWFSRESFTYRDLADDAAKSSFVAKQKVKTYRWKGNSKEFGSVSVGDKCYLLQGDENSEWVQIIYPVSGGNKMGWVYGRDYAAMKGIEVIDKNKDSYTEKVNKFLSDNRFKNGASWGSEKKPYLSSYSGKGCCAYAADFVNYVFGENSPRNGKKFTNSGEIKAGDVIIVTGSQHWFVVISRNGDSLKVAEGNWGGKVVVTDGVYTVKNNTLYRNGEKFRTFSAGYHFQ